MIFTHTQLINLLAIPGYPILPHYVHSFLFMCPRNFNHFFLNLNRSLFPVHIFFGTSLLFTYPVHGTSMMLRKNYISVASSPYGNCPAFTVIHLHLQYILGKTIYPQVCVKLPYRLGSLALCGSKFRRRTIQNH